MTALSVEQAKFIFAGLAITVKYGGGLSFVF
jgi:hypothetical protein